LRPKYAALVQDRLYVVESNRPIIPDVALVETNYPTRAAAAVLELDEPIVFQLRGEEIRQPYIQIVEPAAGNRLITAIEVLSPDNKMGGDGRKNYLKKRKEYRAARANLVEIDLLRGGKPPYKLGAEDFARLPPWRYLTVVTRRPRIQEVYATPLEKRLPRVRIPLTRDDPDVGLDLQAVFTRCWQEGPYPELLQYEGPPLGTMTAEEIAWCDRCLRAIGFRAPQ